MLSRIGITSTIPVEVLFAAGFRVADLNNLFITHSRPADLVSKAEEEGLPRNLCSWVKGIYSVLLQNPDIKTVIAVTEGDCSNTLSMLDILREQGIEIITFSYPYNRKEQDLDRSIKDLEAVFGVSRKTTEAWRGRLNRVRRKALEVDRLTWQENKISGLENHINLISCSDFLGDLDKFEESLDSLIEESENRPTARQTLRLGFCGVPAIFSDLYEYLEKRGARVVFNEMQRQFAMPYEAHNIVEQYLHYTYPYSYARRIEDIKRQAKIRNINGVIHYVQSFCHHQIHDRNLKKTLKMPSLTIEGDKPGELLENTRIRIESFLEMLVLKNDF